MEILISNEKELEDILNNAIYKAIDYVMENIYIENRELIQKIVYDVYRPKKYKRTYELRDSWIIDMKQDKNSTTGTLTQDWQDMTLNINEFQHGDKTSGDLREYVTDMVINGYGYYFDAQDEGWDEPRDFWTPLINKLDSGKVMEWFNQSMKEQGFEGIIVS